MMGNCASSKTRANPIGPTNINCYNKICFLALRLSFELLIRNCLEKNCKNLLYLLYVILYKNENSYVYVRPY